jgi:hypothetical protein
VERACCPCGSRGISGKGYARMDDCRSGKAHVAQSVERVLGKDEVSSSILLVGSRQVCARPDSPEKSCHWTENGLKDSVS